MRKMEDENGIELSLGLSCGGSSVKSKGKNVSSSDSRADEGDKGNKLVDDFKNFLDAGFQHPNSNHGSQRGEPEKPQENFFNNLSRATVDADASMNLTGRGLWVTNNNRFGEAEEEKSDKVETGGKRKMLFDEINHPKKQEREGHYIDVPEKGPQMGTLNSSKTSLISINTEDGSTAENEDVAESEIEGSTSRLVSHHEDVGKRCSVAGGSSEVPNEVHGFTDSSSVNSQGQKRFSIQPDNDFKLGNATYGVPFAVQPIPYSLSVKEPNSVSAPSTSGYPRPGMMQLTLPPNGERPGTQPLNSGSMSLTFGYSPVQLPTLDKDHARGLVSNPQQFPHSSIAGRGTGGLTATSDKHNDGSKISQASVLPSALTSTEAAIQCIHDATASELVKGDGKQHATEEGSSSQTEDDAKGHNTIFKAKDASDLLPAEVFPHEGSVIRPGIAADVKFGGCGSFPKLPWVSTTGPGPNGRTISGVTYRFSRNQVRIVCACHGLHMTPEEFIQHASEEHTNQDAGTGIASFPNSNPAASAQS